jgi:HEAT repeat protein
MAGSERGTRLQRALGELSKRKSEEALNALGSAAGALYDEEVQKVAREALAGSMSQQSTAVVLARLKDDRVEGRIAAAVEAGKRGLAAAGGDLIALLEDDEPRAREAALQALVKIAKGVNFGPAPKANDEERAAAVMKWREWWAQQGGR